MDNGTALESAYKLLHDSILSLRGQPVGILAACDANMESQNYAECFIRDFIPSALVFLMNGETAIVRNFLHTVMQLQGQQKEMAGHGHAAALMPASFRIETNAAQEQQLLADFGDRAIGRVAPVDSAMWWMILLRAYTLNSGDTELVRSDECQQVIRRILQLYLRESFETSPAMLVPDASFMIDRRMGVYGHPLEIQSLFYGTLLTAQELLQPTTENEALLEISTKRMKTLRSYVRLFYWLDIARLNSIHRYKGEEFGLDAVNILNIFPESIPDWLDGWLDSDSGYLVGNLGPSRIDFRFFSLGNLLAILFGLTTDEQAQRIMNTFELHWDQLVGQMPLTICFPAVVGKECNLLTGSDPKNAPWSYHNGGHWPALLWAFSGAALRTGRADLSERALQIATEKLPRDNWPEYYDGRTGSLIGRRANLYQTWTAAAYIIGTELMINPDSIATFDALTFSCPG